MDCFENEEVAVSDLASFVVIGDAKGEFYAFLDEGIKFVSKR